MSLEGYREVPFACRWAYARTRADRLSMRRADDMCQRAMRREAGEPPEPEVITPGYQPPISTEARYSRSKGKHGRRRGSKGDDPAPSMQKRPSGNWSALAEHRTVGELTAGIDTRHIPRSSPPNQPPICRAAFPLPWCSRASAIQNRGDTAS
jgi:hypothetical protein